eukprot:scaffold20560_cov33-Cyclotella_meneghiniana.AAC.1
MAEAPFRETQPAEPIEQSNICSSITMAAATAFLLVGAAVSVVASLNVDSDDTVDYAVELQNATETFFSSPSDHSPLIPLQPTDVWGFTLAAFANTWWNVKRRHPSADRPLIDWDLILVMEPPTLFGALVGANLNKVLSETIIAVMLVVLLSFTAQNTFKKAFKIVSLIVFMFLVVVVVNILKGGGGFPSPIGITCGSLAFWSAQLLLHLFIVMIAAIARKRLIKDTRRKMDAGYMYLKEDIIWDERSTVVYPLVSSIAGFCAGMFGIGGGIVKGPLMLAMGVHPAVASATSACMILFTSLTATTTFAVYGMLVKDYAIVCVFLGLLSTAFGQKVMSSMVKKTKRNSFIAFSIGVVVLLSALLMTLQSVLHLMSDRSDEQFSGICASHLNTPPV